MEQIEKYEADGIDFVPIMIQEEIGIKHVIESYTKEQFENVKYIPKTNYLIWKIVDGEKVYIT